MSTGQEFAGKCHCSLVPSVAALELWLTLRDETNHLDGSRPSMLNQRAILNLDIETGKSFAGFGVDVVLIYVVNASIPGRFGMLEVIVFVWLIAEFVIESCSVKF
jgi:hypothetical protein